LRKPYPNPVEFPSQLDNPRLHRVGIDDALLRWECLGIDSVWATVNRMRS